MRVSRRGIELFRAFGITVKLDYSWFIFFALVTWTFERVYIAEIQFANGAARWLLAVAAALLLFFSVLFHEMSHAVTSNRLGFPIEKITLFIFGGVAHMKGEPEDPKTEFLVALAGPVSSLFLAVVFGVAAELMRMAGGDGFVVVLSVIAWMNLALAIFNLVPGFPLDGGRLLRSLIWWKTKSLKRATNIAAKLGEGFAWFLMAAGAVLLFTGKSGWVQGIWYILIGIFLKAAAEQSYQHLLMEDVLEGISVADIMGRQVMTVAEDDPLDQIVSEKFLHHKFTAYPVVNREGYVVGVVDFRDVKNVPREERDAKSVLEVMHLVPLAHLPRPATNAFDALREMLSLGLAQLPVVDDDGRLAGIVTRTDIMSMFQIRSDLADQVVV